MDKGSMFERDGTRYEVLKAGIEYVARNKSACVRPLSGSKCITITQSLHEGLIRETIPGESYDLFTKARKEDSGKREQKVTLEEPFPPESPECKKVHTESESIYFMPVDQLRAQVFLAHGLIYPAVYDKAGLSTDFDDSQRLAPADLTLFQAPQPLNKNQLLLKILLHPEEISKADVSGNILHFSFPLPISRLAGIEVPSAVGSIDRYIDGWVKPDVPVPRHLFTTAPTQFGPEKGEPGQDYQNRSASPKPVIAESILKFDRYLGVMAFLRNTGRYFSENTGNYADYPDVFFSVYEQVLGKSDLKRSERQPPAPLLLALMDLEAETSSAGAHVLSIARSKEPYIEKEKARRLAMEIYNGASEKETLAHAFKMLFSGDYRSAIQMLQRPEIPVEAAVLATLFKFSGRQSNDHRTVKQRLHDDWSNQNQAILVLAAIGAYHGYTALDARETSLYSVHPLIKPLIEDRPDIKFHLATNFERHLIEALYQRAFLPTDQVFDTGALYSAISAPKASPNPKVTRILVRDSSYIVQDLVVRRYEVTLIGRIIQRLKAWKRETIDEQSEVGRYLMSQCFFIADEYELSRRAGKQTLRYRIAKSKVIDLITEEKIAFNPRVLEVAIEEDTKGNGR